jgi:NAD/NADP transhydrogenase alpha subunit
MKVQVEKGAGQLSSFRDEDYEKVGAKVVAKNEALAANIILKVSQNFFNRF